MSNKFSKEYTINIYDVDSKMQCKFSSILNYLWDVVISQSDTIGETNDGIINNCAWVLFKYDIKIHEYPKYKDNIRVETDVLGVKKFYGFRGGTIYNSKGKVIAEIVSVALLIDIEKRRPMRMLPSQLEIYGITSDIKEDIPLDDLKKLESEEYFKEFIIRYSDIDSNNHVNNARYVDMAIESLPIDITTNYKLSRLKIVFKKEAIYGDTLRVSSQVINNTDNKITTIHSIIGNAEKNLTKLELEWNSL